MYLDNIVAFYQLQKLIIQLYVGFNDLTIMSNKTVTEIELSCYNPNGAHSQLSLKGIENFPQLESLTISRANLNVDTILKATNHKIKKLRFHNCIGINMSELQTYCQMNNIDLLKE